jgi:cardiolipin synthase A/B
MSQPEAGSVCKWFCAGDEVFPEMLAAIDAAKSAVSLEMYIFSDGALGQKFLAALLRARQRGVRVRVLVDAAGSFSLPGNFWEPLAQAGGAAKQFNPVALKRVWIRDHRKLLACDERVAFIGGFNIAPEYEGDGVTRGWLDTGLKIEGPLAALLAASFEEMFARAEFRVKRFARLRKFTAKKSVAAPDATVLLSGPGRGANPLQRVLKTDLAKARDVKIMAAYFLPTRQLRQQLIQVVRRGGRVQLLLAGKSDVLLSQLAGQSLYRRLLKGGVEIFEYQPQILHAKLVLVDDVVYTGSANLDQRSLKINYELMVRFEKPEMAGQARELFSQSLLHCLRIEPAAWRSSRTLWRRVKQRLAYWLLMRLDPWVARWQWRSLPK